MSLGGSRLDAIEKAAIDYTISKGVIIEDRQEKVGKLGWVIPEHIHS